MMVSMEYYTEKSYWCNTGIIGPNVNLMKELRKILNI